MGIEVSFSLDSKSFESALLYYPKNLEKEIRRASKKVAATMEKQAKSNHRFTTRTGRLVKSIKGYGTESSIELVLLDTDGRNTELGTKYGKYVNEGWSRNDGASWSPDKFIQKAFSANIKKGFEAWSKAVSKANKEF